MVLWEITLGTAYFLGLKRTYRLALKLQRRIDGKKHPKIKQLLYGRTRAGFDMALRVHRSIQERDLEAGRTFGNWILRFLDRAKPSAQIRGNASKLSPTAVGNTTEQVTGSSNGKSPATATPKSKFTSPDTKLGGPTFPSPMNAKSKSFTTVANNRHFNPASRNFNHRNYCTRPELQRSLNYGKERFEGVVRKDIMQWMLQN